MIDGDTLLLLVSSRSVRTAVKTPPLGILSAHCPEEAFVFFCTSVSAAKVAPLLPCAQVFGVSEP